jgi:LacI family transcriptional regulator
MQYLTGLGHRRIGYIGGRPELQSSTQRMQGYTDGLTQVGLPLEPDLVQAGDYTRQTGYLSAQKLLSLPKPPTAVFALTLALGVIRPSGTMYPEKTSVVGFNIIPESAYFTALTTVDQSIDQTGILPPIVGPP